MPRLWPSARPCICEGTTLVTVLLEGVLLGEGSFLFATTAGGACSHGAAARCPVTPSGQRVRVRGPSGHPRTEGWPPSRPAHGAVYMGSSMAPGHLRARLLDCVKTAGMWALCSG